ncbi:MAG: UDP-glucose 4-epimerase [Arenicella sp.]|jgi:UDP-glucose 4-epimerase
MHKYEEISILVAGGSGAMGHKLIKQLLIQYPNAMIHCLDVQAPLINSNRLTFHDVDIRSQTIHEILKVNNCKIVFHLIAIMDGVSASEEEIFDIEVNGLQNIINASIDTEVEHFIFISSGAVYGYKPGLPRFIPESQSVETNNIIRYGRNKAIAENLLQSFCIEKGLDMTIFRPCSILGADSSNIVSKWFDRKVIIGLKNTLVPFSFVWEDDLIACFLEAMQKRITGVYNVTGKGWVSLEQIAQLQSKKYLPFHKERLQKVIGLLNRMSLIRYKKEHLDFLKYRPVLDRKKLTSAFSYKFKWTSLEAFERYLLTH